ALGGQLNRGATNLPGVGGLLQLLGTAGSIATAEFGLPALTSESGRQGAMRAYRTLEGGEPGLLDIPAYARALTGAREARAGELATTAESETSSPWDRAIAALGQFFYGALPNVAPVKFLPEGVRGAKATAAAADRVPGALEKSVGEAAPGAGVFGSRDPARGTAGREGPPEGESPTPHTPPETPAEPAAKGDRYLVEGNNVVDATNRKVVSRSTDQAAAQADADRFNADPAAAEREIARRRNPYIGRRVEVPTSTGIEQGQVIQKMPGSEHYIIQLVSGRPLVTDRF